MAEKSNGPETDREDKPRLTPHAVPEPPKLETRLPDRPKSTAPAEQDGGGYGRSAIASTAVSSFMTPIVVLCLGGYWLDQRLHHKTLWFAILGLLLGLVVGTMSLIRVLERMSR